MNRQVNQPVDPVEFAQVQHLTNCVKCGGIPKLYAGTGFADWWAECTRCGFARHGRSLHHCIREWTSSTKRSTNDLG